MHPVLRRRGVIAAVLLCLAAAPALARQQGSSAAPTSPAAAAVGHWLYDERGVLVGSVKSLSADGHTATIRLGVYLHGPVRIVEVPADAISVEGGRAVLQPDALRVAGRLPGQS